MAKTRTDAGPSRASRTPAPAFSSLVAHELHEPLRAIRMFCDLLERDAGPILGDRPRSHLERIRAGVSRMRDVIEDLRRLGEFESEGLHRAPVSVRDVVGDVVDSLAVSLEESRGEVAFQGLPVIDADRGLLELVFRNLIENAIKYRSAEPPRIVVTHERQADRWRFVVEDNGIGLDPEDCERIFEPFERVGSDRRGSGLGLSLVKAIVTAHAGTVGVESEPDEGSRFWFDLCA